MNSATFPWPPAALSPNARGHWSKKAKAAKKYRADCYYLAKAAKLAVDWEGSVQLHLVFCPPDLRRRDRDNLLAACKSLIDGLADALRIDDNRVQPHIALSGVRKGGAVFVSLARRLESNDE